MGIESCSYAPICFARGPLSLSPSSRHSPTLISRNRSTQAAPPLSAAFPPPSAPPAPHRPAPPDVPRPRTLMEFLLTALPASGGGAVVAAAAAVGGLAAAAALAGKVGIVGKDRSNAPPGDGRSRPISSKCTLQTCGRSCDVLVIIALLFRSFFLDDVGFQPSAPLLPLLGILTLIRTYQSHRITPFASTLILRIFPHVV